MILYLAWSIIGYYCSIIHILIREYAFKTVSLHKAHKLKNNILKAFKLYHMEVLLG